jgi:TRAP transporter TAXI family solute receptor
MREQMKRTVFIAAAAGAAFVAAGASAQTYSIGTNPQGSLFYATGAAIAKVMVEKTGMQFRVQPMSGSSTYMPLIHAGKLAFGMANTAESYYAFSGAEKELYRQPHPNLRQVAETFGVNSFIAVPMDSPIKRISDLKGKKLPGVFTGGRIFHFLQKAALATDNMTDKDVNIVPTPNFVAGVKLFMAGRADAAYMPLNAGISKQANATVKGGIRYLKTDCSAAGEDRLQAIVPPASMGRVKPAKNQTGVIENPTCLVNVPFTLVTGVHVPDDVVYKVVMTIYKNKKSLAAALGAFNRMNPKNIYRKHPNGYHPGAIKAYKELGLIK